MKAKLEFDLDDPSDRKAHKRCVSATDVYLCLHDIDNMLRQKIKYELPIEENSNTALLTVESIREEIYSILELHGINMEDLE
jgi:hypothetical protein